ncbi:MAG: hypothetical protein GY853_10065 [PVC group bacterium]|nr:hypothetical protein [PVC group bacterium]
MKNEIVLTVVGIILFVVLMFNFAIFTKISHNYSLTALKQDFIIKKQKTIIKMLKK